MSEIERVLGEYGVSTGQTATLALMDRSLMIRALQHYGDHLLDCATTLRAERPAGTDPRASAGNLEITSARAKLLASMIDLGTAVTIEGCGKG